MGVGVEASRSLSICVSVVLSICVPAHQPVCLSVYLSQRSLLSMFQNVSPEIIFFFCVCVRLVRFTKYEAC